MYYCCIVPRLLQERNCCKVFIQQEAFHNMMYDMYSSMSYVACGVWGVWARGHSLHLVFAVVVVVVVLEEYLEQRHSIVIIVLFQA